VSHFTNSLNHISRAAHKAAKQATGGGLGYPSKMPGTSYGISALMCKVGSKLAQIKGSTCEICYALSRNYRYPSVTIAHANRLASLKNPQWTGAMAYLIQDEVAKGGEPYHRWHDSGDLQSVEHMTKICAVAALTPQIKHWLPTRELKTVQDYLAQGGTIPDNLTVRLSAYMIDRPATQAWPVTSGVHTDTNQRWISRKQGKKTYVCPAPKQGNKCMDCRACWSKNVPHVSYHQH